MRRATWTIHCSSCKVSVTEKCKCEAELLRHCNGIEVGYIEVEFFLEIAYIFHWGTFHGIMKKNENFWVFNIGSHWEVIVYNYQKWLSKEKYSASILRETRQKWGKVKTLFHVTKVFHLNSRPSSMARNPKILSKNYMAFFDILYIFPRRNLFLNKFLWVFSGNWLHWVSRQTVQIRTWV